MGKHHSIAPPPETTTNGDWAGSWSANPAWYEVETLLLSREGVWVWKWEPLNGSWHSWGGPAEPPRPTEVLDAAQALAWFVRHDLPVPEELRGPAAPAEDALGRIAQAVEQIAHARPVEQEVVGTPAVAKLLGCTTTWVADMVRRREIPAGCVLPGSGSGRPWKFYRVRVEAWIKERRS